jgi:ABC-type multidrug transport system permease subunit
MKILMLLLLLLTLNKSTQAIAYRPVSTAIKPSMDTLLKPFYDTGVEELSVPNIDLPIYIIMSLFFMGWLAIGINSNFEDQHWLYALAVSLLTAGLGGLAYALILMPRFYDGKW